MTITSQEYLKTRTLQNKAITDRGYERTHKFGQWMHVEGEMGRGILIMSSWNRASGYCAESSWSSWWKILSIDNIHKPQRWIPRTISSLCVRLLVCGKTRAASVWVLVSVNERNTIAPSRRTALRVLISLVCLVKETKAHFAGGKKKKKKKYLGGPWHSEPTVGCWVLPSHHWASVPSIFHCWMRAFFFRIQNTTSWQWKQKKWKNCLFKITVMWNLSFGLLRLLVSSVLWMTNAPQTSYFIPFSSILAVVFFFSALPLSMHHICPQFSAPWPSAPPTPTEEFNSGGNRKMHDGGGSVWISVDVSLNLWRNGWQNTDSPGPGVRCRTQTHMQKATGTDRQAAASIMGNLMEMIHGWIHTHTHTQDMMVLTPKRTFPQKAVSHQYAN